MVTPLPAPRPGRPSASDGRALDEPRGVVARNELADERARLGQRREAMQVEALFLQRSHEALRHAVALRLADVGRRDRDAEPLHLVDPGVGDVLRAPITAQAKPARDVFAEPPIDLAYALANGFERRPAIAELRHVPADEVVAVVIDRSEEPAPAVLLGVEARRVGAPQRVGPRGDDGPGVGGIPVRGTQPAGRQELMLAHQPQDACRRRPRPGAPAAPAPSGSLHHGTASRSGHGGSRRPGRGR